MKIWQNFLPEKEAQLKSATEEIEKLKADLTKAETDFTEANKTYDREKHTLERAALNTAEKRLAETRANLENAKRRADELKKELETLRAIRLEMQFEFKEKERLEKVAEATDFIRETLKKSAPLVARNYVYHVSLEANQMFREISGNAERTLKWTEDYGIVLEEFGHERPFIKLVRRRTDGGGFVRSARAFKTTFRHSPRVFRRTDNQYGRGAARTSRRTNQPHHRTPNLRSAFRHLARRYV